MSNTPAAVPQSAPAPRKRPGRPTGSTIPPEQRKSAAIHERLTPAQKAKYLRLGAGDWLRERIDRARE